jgi:hypothetical protein
MKNKDVIGISATKGAAILGFPGYQTSFQVWQGWVEKLYPGFNEKMGFIMPEGPEGPALRWGLAFEDAIVKIAEEKQGWEIFAREKFVSKGLFYQTKKQYSKEPKILGYIDGLYDGLPKKIHEGKTTSQYFFKENFGEPGTDRVPLTYQCQCQHLMMCTGAKKTILSVLVFPKRVDEFEALGYTIKNHGLFYSIERLSEKGELIQVYAPQNWASALDQMGYFYQYEIPANEYFQDLMFQKYRIWWNKHMIRREIPEPGNYEDFKRIISEPVGTIVVDQQTAAWYKEYKEIGKEIGKSGSLSKAREQKRLMILEKARKLEPTLDDESTDKWIFRDKYGKKLGSYNGKTFR